MWGAVDKSDRQGSSCLYGTKNLTNTCYTWINACNKGDRFERWVWGGRWKGQGGREEMQEKAWHTGVTEFSGLNAVRGKWLKKEAGEEGTAHPHVGGRSKDSGL